jgi:hypothetical protein
MNEKAGLNDSQKAVLWIGIAVGAVMLLYPPWVEAPELVEVGETVIRYGPERDLVPEYAPKSGSPLRHDTSAGYSFLFDPPPRKYPRFTEVRINWGRLLIQWAAVACVTAFTISWCKQTGHRKEMDSPLPAQKMSEAPIVSHIPKTVLEAPEEKEQHLANSKQTDCKLADLARSERLSKCEHIYLTNSDVTDPGLAYLKGAPTLRSLILADTAVTDAGLVVLRELTNLRCLNLAGTKINDPGLGILEGLSELEALLLSRTAITDTGIVYLRNLVNLRTLYLSSTRITDTGLQSIKGLVNLRTLYLDSTRITETGLEDIKGLTELEHLNLNYTSISDKGILPLKGLFKLSSIALSGTRVTDAGLVNLKGLADLHSLVLNNDEITDLGLENIKGLKHLQYLCLGPKITDAGLAHLESLTNLSSLVLQGPGITDAGLARLKEVSFLPSGPSLQHLHLYDTQVTQPGIDNMRRVTRDIQRFKRPSVSWEPY